ncbi:SSL2 DNA or RNA helicases of superfamily II [uncultured Caudovirales phage]|uniref:SSL2 DNA or RNA helicases of superfamily II n=1 Tax=uncultured Caudovirales phage TaxID=2100421 RepID=A0A6J5KRP0_9CAUD|nr:SSL2 DNA or RNA helicases of superfamily II [uncultured Caudovirales phage]
MHAIITNKFTIVKDPTPIILQSLTDLLSYEDKAVKYQLRRMERNPFQKDSGYYKKLQKEADGCLLKPMGSHIAFNSGLSYLIDGKMTIEDKRIDTGSKIAYPWKKKPYPLRTYQEEAVDACASNWRGIVNMATGMGKSLVALYLIKKLQRKTLIIVPSDSIAKQFYKELSETYGEDQIGFYGGGKKKIKNITVGIAASVIKATEEFKNADLGLIIFDECHHTPASTFIDIAVALGDVGRIYGLSATDYRSDGKDIMINAACGDVLIKRDVVWGVANGFLAKPKFIVKNIATTGTDFKHDKLKCYKEHVLNNDTMKKQIEHDIRYYQSLGKSVLILVGEVAHGAELSKSLGVLFAQGKDKASQSYVEQLNAGTISTLIGTSGKIGEGCDTKNVDVLILAQFVAAKGLTIQAVGRGLRKQGNKTECTIIDYIPLGSSMLTRHAKSRIEFYKEITNDITIL